MRRALAFALGIATVAACAKFSGDGNGVVTTSDAGATAPTSDAAPTPTNDGAVPPIDGAATTCGTPGPTGALVLYLPFDDAVSPLRDCSGNGHDGTFVGDGGVTTGKQGNALFVDHTAKAGCVTLGTSSALQVRPMTVAAWIRPDSFPVTTDTGYIIGQTAADVNEGGWRLATTASDDDDDDYVIWTGGGFTYDFEWGKSVSTWQHVAVTLDASSQLTAYLDGAPVDVEHPQVLSFLANIDLRIGCKSNNSNYFDGAIDELRMYARVLSAVEITQLAAD